MSDRDKTAAAALDDPAPSRVTGLCGICPAGCGVEIHMADGRIDRLKPLKGHPLGYVCPRGARAPEIVYSPDRLLYPQRRIGERGEGRFERISWDEAYDEMVCKLREIADTHGPQAACIYSGRGNFEFGLTQHFAPAGPPETEGNAVLFPFGSPTAASVGSLCYISYGLIAPKATFGAPIRDTDEDFENADVILVWGANPVTDSPPLNLRRLKRAKARGARIVVIDPRRSETARALNAEWVAIRPGTDGALALGMIAVLIAEDLYDHAFVEDWTHGFADLAAYAATFTPERVAAITGVAADRVSELARAVGAARGAAIATYTGLEYSNSGVQSIRAVWILQAIAGHLDVPGGKLFRMPQPVRPRHSQTAAPTGGAEPLGAETFPVFHEVRAEAHATRLPGAILDGDPYPVRALIQSGASLITSWPNPELWRKALASLEFHVVIDRFPTADSTYADLLLPATTHFEIESYVFRPGFLQLRERVIEPLGEARNDYLIFAELAERLGYGHRWPQNEQDLIEAALEGTGITLAELRRHPEGITLPVPEMRYTKYQTGDLRGDGKPGFETPTGKFEIASEWLRAHGHEPLPVYTEPLESPRTGTEAARRYPLIMSTGARTQSCFRSQHVNIPSLLARQPNPLVHMNRRDAAKRGIADGDPVAVISPRGRVPYWAAVSDDVVEGAVEVNMGGGGVIGPAAWRNANVNQLTDLENLDPISGFPVFKALSCEVEKRDS